MAAKSAWLYATDVDEALKNFDLMSPRFGPFQSAPLMTLLGVTRLAIPGLLFEIEATAVAKVNPAAIQRMTWLAASITRKDADMLTCVIRYKIDPTKKPNSRNMRAIGGRLFRAAVLIWLDIMRRTKGPAHWLTVSTM